MKIKNVENPQKKIKKHKLFFTKLSIVKAKNEIKRKKCQQCSLRTRHKPEIPSW